MITALGSVGTNVVRNTSGPRSATVTLSSGVPAGNWLVAWFATQSAWDISRPTDSYNWAFAEDSKVNPWMLIASGEHSDTSSNGVMLHLYMTEVQRALVAGDTITALIGNHFAGQSWVRCLSVERFSVAAGKRLAISGNGFTGNSDGSASDPVDVSFTFPGPDREVLYIHGLGYRGPVTDTFTWDSDYTQITAAGSNTGTATDDRTVMGSYRIATVSGNSDTVSITSTTDRSWVQLMQALVEVSAPVGFPSTPLLDDFNRADENPLDNGTWHTDRSSFGFPKAQIVSHEARGGGSQWIGEQVQCQEVWGTVSDWASCAIHFNAAGDVNLGNFAARGAQWVNPATTLPSQEGVPIAFGSANIFGEIRSQKFMSYVAQHTTPPDGTKLGIRRSLEPGLWADHLFVDMSDGDGWRCIGSTCVSTGLGVLYQGRMSIGTNGGWDNFGGGEISCVLPRRPQIYRWVSN